MLFSFLESKLEVIILEWIWFQKKHTWKHEIETDFRDKNN